MKHLSVYCVAVAFGLLAVALPTVTAAAAADSLNAALGARAEAITEAFARTEAGSGTNLFRAVFGPHLSNAPPDPGGGTAAIVAWLERDAKAQVGQAARLRFGDVLLQLNIDEIGSSEVDNPALTGEPFFVYLGQGLVAARHAAPAGEPCYLKVTNLRRSYTAAYRVVDGFARFRLSQNRLARLRQMCTPRWLRKTKTASSKGTKT